MNRQNLYCFMLVILLQSMDSMAAPTVITFNEYAGDTRIDNQYAPLGVTFRAAAAIGTVTEIPNCKTIPSHAYDKYGFPSPPGLRCKHPSFDFTETDPDVPVISRFYDYESGILWPAYAWKISFDLSIVTGSGASISAYDTNDEYLTGTNINGSGVQRVNLDVLAHKNVLAHKLVISVPGTNSQFAIDNLSFELFKLIIEQPTKDQIFSLTLNNYRETEISYKTNIVERGVEFSTKLEWATARGHGQTLTTERFSASGTNAVKRTYTAKGGKLTVDASFTEDARTAVARPVTAFIVGSAIPDSDITSRLYSLYGGATPGLLTGIAMRESSYAQFKDVSKYGQTVRWPNESDDGGSHIGLMQVVTTYERAWDWHANTEYAARLFTREKLPAARRNENAIRRGEQRNNVAGRPGLRELTDTEREMMALVLYGPFAPGGPNVPVANRAEQLAKQYYVPVCQGGVVTQQRNDLVCEGGLWEWIPNVAGNPAGVDYADDVWNRIR